MRTITFDIEYHIGPGGKVATTISVDNFDVTSDTLPEDFNTQSIIISDMSFPQLLKMCEDGIARLNMQLAYIRRIADLLAKCESPIEEVMCQALCHYGWTFSRELVPQCQVGRYRLDFAIPNVKLGIEVDGHDYHKTKAQRAHDAKRDRDLSTLGWHIMRFTGSEIYRSLLGCVREVMKQHALLQQGGNAEDA